MSSGTGHVPPRVALRGFVVGRIGGIDIVVAPSWVASVAVIAALGVPVVSQVVPGTTTAVAVVVSIVLGVLLGASVLAHELGHCLAARMLGMRVNAVRLYLLGGVSELARVPRSPREEAIVAGAGPAVSALLAGICYLGVQLTTPGTVGWLLVMLLALSNLIIAVFNLLPALPLDGGRVVRAGVWGVSGNRRAGTTAAVIGGYVLALMLVVWAVVLLVAAGSAGLLPAGIAIGMALFVVVGVVTEGGSRAAADGRKNLSIGQLTRPVRHLPINVPVGAALQAAADSAVILIQPDGVSRGLLDVTRARSLAARDPSAPASLVVRPIPPDAIVLTGDDPVSIVARARTTTVDAFVVVDDTGRPAGVVSTSDLLAAADRRRSVGRMPRSRPTAGERTTN